jgi:hypothetical protein
MIKWLKTRSTQSYEIKQLESENQRLKAQCQQIEQARVRRGDQNLSKKAKINNAQGALDLFATESFNVAYCDLVLEYERNIFTSSCVEDREVVYRDMIALQRVASKLNSMVKLANIRPAKQA